MLKILKSGLILGGLLLSPLCYSQDVPLGTLPLFYNSSFAGEGDEPRINSNLHYSDFSGLRLNRVGIHTSYDQFIPQLRSGVGISAAHYGRSGFNPFPSNYSSIALAIAPKFSLKGKVTLSPSLDFQYGRQSSQFYNIRGYSTRIGVLLNSSKFFLGYSLNAFSRMSIEDLATSQVQRGVNNYNRLHSTFQLGYTFQRSQESRFSFTPQVLFFVGRDFKFERGMSLFKFMMNFKYDRFLWGISDNGLHVGWQTPRVRIMAFNNVERIFENQARVPRRENISTLSFRYVFKK